MSSAVHAAETSLVPQAAGLVGLGQTVEADPHHRLREDVRDLGRVLGRVIQRVSGTASYARIERVRALSKRAEQGDDDALVRLQQELRSLSVSEAAELAHAFSAFLSLANTAEQHHRLRRRRAYLRQGGAPQRGSCADALSRLAARGVASEQLHAALCDQHVELVLTAHPTEIARRTLLDKHVRISEALRVRDQTDLLRDERIAADLTIEREVLSLYSTDALRRTAPTPDQETDAALSVVERTLWHALPRHLRALDEALLAATSQPLPLDAVPVRFGSWIGGDRDGNPFVDSQVTERSVYRARAVGARLFHQDLTHLIGELSMQSASARLRERVGEVAEPYRALLRPLVVELGKERDAALERALGQSSSAACTLTDLQLIDALRLAHESLCETGFDAVASGRLLDVLRRAACFGLSLVRLDVRQHARVIERALDEITRALELGSYAAWSEGEKLLFLRSELQSRRPLIPQHVEFSALTRDLLRSLTLVAELPAASLGAFVISGAEAASDVLAPLVLQRALGVLGQQRVVPLFESLSSLQRAPALLDSILAAVDVPSLFGSGMEIMLGYSDSAKDGGVLAASWLLYRAQESLMEVGRRHGLRITFFHGRGGTVARGGGPTYLAIQSLPAGSLDNGVRVTEQGEMIHAKFGSIELAERSLELYTTATLEARLVPPTPPDAEQRALLDALSARSSEAYRQVVDAPGFISYFHSVTPLAGFEGLNLGSRPTRRSQGSSVQDLRAIPWIFAWAQTRLVLASWLGVGTALAWAKEQGHAQAVERLAREQRFGRSMFELFEMVLAKADLRMASTYDLTLAQGEDLELGARLRGMLRETRERVLSVTGHARLLEPQPVIERSIAVRNPYLVPIHLLQIELLLRRRRAPDDPAIARALRQTIHGIASGLRNTG